MLEVPGLRGPGAIHYDHVDFECISCGFEVQGLGVWRGFLDSECRVLVGLGRQGCKDFFVNKGPWLGIGH